ncbi:MAG: family 16 glycosylhydrolase [Cytophagaceae bacterium]|nr:family 16 glycosylhydrolase [Cytophagaceae bacterium]MDW8456802.1 family 16 glycosylhydrolase [Cytophagaceae bacterium]
MTLLLLIVPSIRVNLLYAQCHGNLVWNDEFNGTSLDMTKWTYDIGNGCPSLCGWGNNERQYYTNSPTNVSVGGGYLNITALYSPNHLGSGADFTSGRIHTRDKFSRTYGRFEARIRLPVGVGSWPAFWMLPQPPNPYGGWPTSGEIDIMEYRGDITNQVDGTVHYGSAWPANQWDGNQYVLPVSAGNFNNDFHIFAVEWSPGQIRWYMDQVLFKTETQTPNTLNPPSNHAVNWPWNQPFYIILNYALGGWYSGNPTTAAILAGTTFPQTMQVDYVRVYDMAALPFTQQPFNGTPVNITSTIQAEHYDIGCNGDAWFDTDAVNNGGRFRNETPDIEACTDAGAGFNIGWIEATEWLEYTVNIPNSGVYNLSFRIASPNTTGAFRIEVDGTNVTGTINVPSTGGWTNWQTITRTGISLTAGTRILRFYVINGGFNFNYFGGSLVSLPVSVFDFKATYKNHCNQIELFYLPDPNLTSIQLEKSSDMTIWEIADVMSVTQSPESSMKKYYYEDCSSILNKISYYRIRFEYTDEPPDYTHIISVHSGMTSINIYPNPASQYMIIEGISEKSNVHISTVSGVRIRTYEASADVMIPVHDWPTGLYFIQIETPDDIVNKLIYKK